MNMLIYVYKVFRLVETLILIIIPAGFNGSEWEFDSGIPRLELQTWTWVEFERFDQDFVW